MAGKEYEILSSRLTTRNHEPTFALRLWDPRAPVTEAVVKLEERAPFLDLYSTPPVFHWQAQRAAQSVPEGAHGFIIPYDQGRSVSWAVVFEPDIPKERFDRSFLIPDARYRPRSRFTPVDLDSLLRERTNFHRAQSPDQLKEGATNYRVTTSAKGQQVELWPISIGQLRAYREDVLLSRVFKMDEFYSKPFDDEDLADEVRREEVLPRWKGLIDDGLIDVDVTPYSLHSGFQPQQRFRLRFRGYRSTIAELRDEILFAERSDLFRESLAPTEVRPGAPTASTDRIGAYSRQLFAHLAYPSGLLIDPEEPLWSQSAVHDPVRAKSLVRSGLAERMAFMNSDAVRAKICVSDWEAPDYMDTLDHSGQLDSGIIACSDWQVILCIQDPGVPTVGDAVIDLYPDSTLMRAGVSKYRDIPIVGGHNIIGYDLKKLREKPLRTARRHQRTMIESRKRQEAGGEPYSDDEVAKRSFDNQRMLDEYARHGIPLSRLLADVDWELIDTWRAPAAFGADIFPGLSLEAVSDYEKSLSHAGIKDAPVIQQLRYLWEDGIFSHDTLQRVWAPVKAVSLQTGLRLRDVSTHAPADSFYRMRGREVLIDREVLQDATYPTYASLRASRDAETDPADWYADNLIADGRPRFGDFVVGTPDADLEAFWPLIYRYGAVRWLFESRDGFDHPLTRSMTAGALRGFLAEPFTSMCDALSERELELGTMHSLRDYQPESLEKLIRGDEVEQDRRELALARRLRWQRPEGLGAQGPAGFERMPHHALAYANDFAQRLSELPMPRAVHRSAVVSDSDEGLYAFDSGPGFILSPTSAVIMGKLPLAIGADVQPHDPVYAFIARMARDGACERLLRVARWRSRRSQSNKSLWRAVASAVEHEVAPQEELPLTIA